MAAVLLELRRKIRPVREGKFYHLFLAIVIIFATIIYIQLLAHLNLSLLTSLDVSEDIMAHETEPAKLITTRGMAKYNSRTKSVKDFHILSYSRSKIHNISSFNVSSSQAVQYILRSYYKLTNNKTTQNMTENFQQITESNKFNKSEGLIKLVLHINGSDVTNIEKVPMNVTKEISLNSSKSVLVENEIPEISVIGNHLLPVNISRTYSVNNETLVNVKHFHRNFSSNRKHNLRTKNSKRPNYCPLWPSELVGPMQVDQLINLTEIPKENLKLIQDGGKFKPPDCDPRERTAIIIPYRDREKNLQVLLRHLHTVLQRQKIEYGIYVVEMAFPTQFNRGLLANVGFLTASSVVPYTCYIIHDVDLLMQDDRNMYRCGRVPRHLTASNSKYNNKLPYLAYFGGVEAFTPDQYWKVNGFSNLYFGWGGEDDDMVYRIFFTGQHFSRPRQQIGGYVAIVHGKDSSNPQNPNRVSLIKSVRQRMKSDGVRSAIYNRLALEFKPLYTWVYVAAKEAKIMEKYQDYLDGG